MFTLILRSTTITISSTNVKEIASHTYKTRKAALNGYFNIACDLNSKDKLSNQSCIEE